MPKEVKIYYCEKIDDEVSDHIVRVLADLFEIQFRSVGVRIPSKNAWDESNRAYDAKKLLNNVLRDRITYFLWIIQDSITLENRTTFGYAEPSKGAIVSTSKMATRTLAAKEVAFHVGKVLGLKACNNSCIMEDASSFEKLIQKPSTLCETCTLKYKRLKIRYR